MKTPRVSRRNFFKLSAFGAGALALPAAGLVAVAAAPNKEVQAAAEQPEKLAILQPTFNPIASTTAFGVPTDISSGWDGTLWAIDASDAPHLYDPLADQWNPQGEGIEAATAIGNILYVFQGGQYVTVDLTTNTVTSGPTSVAATWPSLPDSFKLQLTGATSEGSKLVLFNGGWYVYADGSKPRAKLTDLINWPNTSNWADGLVDAVFFSEIASANVVYLFRGDEYIVANLYLEAVILGPQPAKSVLPPSLATTGTDAATYYPTSGDTYFFHGTSVVVVPYAGGAGQTYYIPKLFAQWPATWHPVLNHAPSGRVGNLWATTTVLDLVRHDGETWNVMPGNGISASVGQDSTVMVGNTGGLFRWNGTGYDSLGGSDLVQASVGDAEHVWVRNVNNVVYRYNATNGFTTVNLGAGVLNPTHMATNADGTLWHCNSGNANAQRFISEGTAPSAAIPVKTGVVTGVHKVASTGFGTAHLLVAQSGQSQPQMYRYDSPYVFKTAKEYRVWPSSTSAFAQGLGNLYFVQNVDNPTSDELFVRYVALDMHTGREVASYTPADASNQYTGMVFDPIHELVYVGTAPFNNDGDSSTPGELIALDAHAGGEVDVQDTRRH